MCLRKVKHQKHNSALCWDDEKLSFLGGLSVFVSRREERGWAKWVKGAQRCRLPGIKSVCHGDAVASEMGTIVSNTAVRIWKVPREETLKVLTTRKKKKKSDSLWRSVVSRLPVAIILQYIQISNHYVVQVNLIWYDMSVISQQNTKAWS